MGNRELDEYLEKIFANINTWLNFAEAKNAANLALIIAFIAGVFSFGSIKVMQCVIGVVCVLSGLLSLIAFIPKLGKKIAKWYINKRKKKNRKKQEENLLFFEDIKNYSGSEYAKKISKVYLQKREITLSKYQLDLADEIVYNADIASQKYMFFKWAVFLDIVAFLILIIEFLLEMIG